MTIDRNEKATVIKGGEKPKSSVTCPKIEKTTAKDSNTLDTTAPPIMLDLSNADRTIVLNGISEMNSKRGDNMTVSFRITREELDLAKKKALEASLQTGKEVNWQQLMRLTFSEKYKNG